ncbi:MAG: histidine phosphatase family protein [Gallionellaceae bacterium]|jgi:broad specificity phosphatase PhoE|nr:histidine phosphatase family protein [Gallionellaceae bacterium]
MAILLVRHAESFANAGGVTMPHGAIPLSDAGRQQAAALAALLPSAPAAIRVSTMLRTRQTAEPYCALVGIAPQEYALLDEFSLVDPALIEGMDGAQRRLFVRRYWEKPDPLHRWGEQADTFAEFAGRVDDFIAKLDEIEDASVIFGHGIWLIMLHWLLRGNSTKTADDMIAFQRYRLAFAMPNCAAFKLENDKQTGWHIDPSFPRVFGGNDG